MSLLGWQKLECKCGSSRYRQSYFWEWHEQYGTVEKVEGRTCEECGVKLDLAGMIARVKEKNLQIKIDELRSQQNA